MQVLLVWTTVRKRTAESCHVGQGENLWTVESLRRQHLLEVSGSSTRSTSSWDNICLHDLFCLLALHIARACYTVLYCTALHCTALHYTTLYYTTKICIAPSRQAKRCGRVAYRLNYIKGIGPIVPAFFLTFRPIHIINCLSNKYLYRIVRLLLPTYKYSTQFERGSSSIQAIRVCQSG